MIHDPELREHSDALVSLLRSADPGSPTPLDHDASVVFLLSTVAFLLRVVDTLVTRLAALEERVHILLAR